MKRSFKVLCLMLVIFMTSGCMKLNVDMSINKDKSMNLSYVVAFANSLIGQSGTDMALDESDLKQAEESGFKVENYSDGSMTGYKFTKDFLNIDSISDEKETVFDLEKLLNGENAKVFTVKKGFFKNKYTVKMLNDTATEIEDEMDLGSLYGDSSNIYSGSSNTFGDSDMDLSMFTSNMDLTFTVNLPNKPINSNATTTENDGKKLEWNLMNQNLQNIEFEFELYNMSNIYLTAGIIGVLIIIIIVIIIMSKKKPNSKKVTPVLVNEQNNQANNLPVLESVTPEENVNLDEPNLNNQNMQAQNVQNTLNNAHDNQTNSSLNEDGTYTNSVQTNIENTEIIQKNVENSVNPNSTLNEDNNLSEIETLKENNETSNPAVTQDIFNASPENK